MDWLNRYAFPAEMAFKDPAHAEAMALALRAPGNIVALGFAVVALVATVLT